MILNSNIIGNISSNSEKIIIIHGLYGNADSWLRVAKQLDSRFEIHLLDCRNHGNSFHDKNHSYNVMTEDLLNYLKSNSIEKVNLIGHSMGGKIVMNFSRKYPEKINRQVIADISPRNYKSLNHPSKQINFHLNLISLFKSLEPEKYNRYKEFSETLTNLDFDIKNIILKNIKKQNGKLEWKINIEAIYNNLDNILDGFSADDFIDHKIKTESLFLKGEKSDYIEKNDEKLIKYIFPNSKLLIIPKSGHWMHIENPNYISREINSFFN